MRGRTGAETELNQAREEDPVSDKPGIGQTTLSLVTLFVTVVGASVAFFEYRDAQYRERVQRVFTYADTFAREAEANERISEFGDSVVTSWPSISASAGENASPDQIKKETDAWFVNSIMADPDLRSSVERMTLFFDTLAVCVSQGLCDEKTAKALFTQQTAAFASTVYPWVEYRNREYLVATGIQTMCLRNRFCGGQTECTGLPAKLASCQ